MDNCTDQPENKESHLNDLHPNFIKAENTAEEVNKIDYSQTYELPSIKTRYFSILIDVIVIFMLSIGVSTILEKIGNVPSYVRGILFFIVVILYEPILVTFYSTIGQLFMNIRVRSFSNPEKKLTIFSLFLRFIVKILLGWLSFVTVTFNNNRRAIHDFASGSIVISNKIEKNS